MTIQVWGFDDGYGDVKGFNGKQEIYYPSNVTTYKEKHDTVLGNKQSNPLSHIVVEYDDKKFLVGQGAVDQDMQSSWIGGNNKHKHPMFPALAKAGLAMLSEDFDNVKVDPIVLGLPVEHSENENRIKELRKIFKKKHEVSLTLADGSKFDKVIDIKDVIVVSQPFGTFCDLILGDDGEIVNPELATKFISIVDIGAGTVNFLTLNDLDPITDLTKHNNKGMYTAYNEIGKRIEEEFGKKYPLGVLPKLIKQGFIAGGNNIQPIVNDVFELHAGELMSEWETLFRNSISYLDAVIFTGGGTEVLKDYLVKYLDEYDFEKIFLGVHNNARGLRKYGIRHAKKKGKQVVRTSGGSIKITENKEVAVTKEG
jgi:plasmid segregation protein ParM